MVTRYSWSKFSIRSEPLWILTSLRDWASKSLNFFFTKWVFDAWTSLQRVDFSTRNILFTDWAHGPYLLTLIIGLLMVHTPICFTRSTSRPMGFCYVTCSWLTFWFVNSPSVCKEQCIARKEKQRTLILENNFSLLEEPLIAI